MMNMMQKTISISPLLAICVGFLTLVSTVTIAYGTMNWRQGGDSKQVEINTKVLATQLPIIYAELKSLREDDGKQKLTTEEVKGDIRATKEALQGIKIILAMMWDNRNAIRPQAMPPQLKGAMPKSQDDSRN